MLRSEIIHLKELIKGNNSVDFGLKESIEKGKKISNFHYWADQKKYEGAFLIENNVGISYWFVLIEWKPDIFYLVLFPENRVGPLIEIHKLENDKFGNYNLLWRYSPTKRDGKNKERVDYFIKYYYDANVVISYPQKQFEVNDFYEEIFSLLEIRIKSDELADDEPSYRNSFLEGKRVERVHISRERNSKVVKLAKAEFKRKYGKLFCEICNFDFEKKYGKSGEDFIEAHHTIPISQILEEQVETKIEDLIMTCSNCHKIIHRQRPWLTIKEMKKILK